MYKPPSNLSCRLDMLKGAVWRLQGQGGMELLAPQLAVLICIDA